MFIVSLPEDTEHLYTVNQGKELHFLHWFSHSSNRLFLACDTSVMTTKNKNISQDFHELENPSSAYYALLLFKKRRSGSGNLPDATKIWKETINLSNYSILDQPLRSE